jgi:hypothetical protein
VSYLLPDKPAPEIITDAAEHLMHTHTEDDWSDNVPSENVAINSRSSLCIFAVFCFMSSMPWKVVVPISVYSRSEFLAGVNLLYSTHLECFQCLVQSRLTLLEQCLHFALAEEVLDLASILLCFNKSVYLV